MKRHWSKYLIVLLSAVLVWLILRPYRTTLVPDELVQQIKPEMTVVSTVSLLGKPCEASDFTICTFHYSLNYPFQRYRWRWVSNRLGLSANIPQDAPFIDRDLQNDFWVSDKHRLLWVASKEGQIIQVWIVPLIESSSLPPF